MFGICERGTLKYLPAGRQGKDASKGSSLVDRFESMKNVGC